MNNRKWTRFVKSFLNLFLKSNCLLCQRPATSDLCPYCRQQLQGCRLADPGAFWDSQKAVFVWGEYGGDLKRAIAALKYNDRPELAKPLGYWMAESWLNFPELAIDNLTVVPIPLHKEKLKQRGFNQAELLAESFCELTGLPLQRHGLERIKYTEALFQLSIAQRQAQMKDALILGKDFRRRLPGDRVLLVDDIYTSGTTVRSATQVLKQSGISVYGTVALASPRKN
ncbi:MAG: ComF family protein [Oscillatoriales cyanobacterium]|uniref:ComF family protein n=1 Tax=Microcoleus anatoxicus PTRS2 TaxID=2705321 RepID=A0ABU8YG85_9CYAN|nr:MAG: ComF family protein [Oscillatoriales cyanobacterium]TAD98602.1 MAG: ComF family protein [Oscillatoriales cyanobacterium]TAF05957.1 MAG: ComF family protein [Oscillatoriales cyanobacterium]TAF47932.1 MAG: ComF family protein [Oscillatoriales cyanobacterium]TAF66315.1 MAG: ComF family protein [Oscillatoriales cyanobacterium]